MLIRKQFKFEGAHIVRNCSSQRCRKIFTDIPISSKFFITSDKLDDGYMVMDFCRLDKVKEFIESFRSLLPLWQNESPDLKTFVYRYNRRVAEIPVSPSAEGYALLFTYVIDKILRHTERVNGEGNIQLHAVRVHETATGYAEAFQEDLKLARFRLKDIHFSEGIVAEWKSTDWWDKLLEA